MPVDLRSLGSRRGVDRRNAISYEADALLYVMLMVALRWLP